MWYNLYRIERDDTAHYTRLEVVISEGYGVSIMEVDICLPNWFECLLGITFKSKLKRAYKKINKFIDKQQDKQLKMIMARG